MAADLLFIASESTAALQTSQFIENATAEISRYSCRGEEAVGVAVWRLDGHGPGLLMNAGQPFPMACTSKIAMACRIVERVDGGELTVGHLLEIPDDMRIGGSFIADRFIHPGVQLSIHNLVEVMLDESDNTATDGIVQKSGGAAAVTRSLEGWGIAGQRAGRDMRCLHRDFYNVGDGHFNNARLDARTRAVLNEIIRFPSPAFEDDLREVSTHFAMNTLPAELFAGCLSLAGLATVLRDIMRACRTSDKRLRGLLPPDTEVIDNTDTISGISDDVDLISLSQGRGEIVISVYVKRRAGRSRSGSG